MPVANIDTVTSVDIEAYIKNAIDDSSDLSFVLLDSSNTNVGAVAFNALPDNESSFSLHTATVGSLTGAMDQARWNGMRLAFDPTSGNGSGSPRLQVSGVRVKITYTELPDPGDSILCGVTSIFFGGGVETGSANGGALMGRDILKGSTDQQTELYIYDDELGTPLTGLNYASSGLSLWYRRIGAAKTSITAVTLSALTDAHADHGFIEIGNGYYRLDGADAAFASGANGVLFGGAVTGGVVVGNAHALVDFNPQDGVRLGLTALPNAAAAASGGLIINGANAAGVAPIVHQTTGAIRYNSTSRRLEVFLQDSRYLDQRGLTGVVYNAAGLEAYFIKDDQGNTGGTSITLANATLGAWTSGGLKEKDATHAAGWYEFGAPNAMFSTSSSKEVVLVIRGAANMAETHIRIPIVYFSLDTSTMPSDMIAIKSTLLGTESAGAGAVANAFTKQYNVGSGGNFTNASYNQGGDNYAQVTHVDHGLAALKTILDGLGGGGGGGPTVGDIVDGILDELIAGHSTTGTVGKALIDGTAAAVAAATNIGTDGDGLTNLGDARIANLDETISSRMAGASYEAPDNDTISDIWTVIENLGTMIVPEGPDYAFAETAFANLVLPEGDDLVEPSPGTPSATPSEREALSLLYFIATNQVEVTEDQKLYKTRAGASLFKQTLTESSETYTEGALVAP